MNVESNKNLNEQNMKMKAELKKLLDENTEYKGKITKL